MKILSLAKIHEYLFEWENFKSFLVANLITLLQKDAQQYNKTRLSTTLNSVSCSTCSYENGSFW